jgi:imidazolonepropionase-like amidohydrolase
MKKALVSILLLTLVHTPLFARQRRPGGQKPFALTHVTVIDVTGALHRRDVTVVISGGRIAAVGMGKFLIPGLWDMHAHLGEEEFDRVAHLALFVANGVTGIRVMEGSPEHRRWRREIEKGTLPGPRMFIASSRIDESKTFEAEAREAVRKAHREGADFVKVYDGLPRVGYFALVKEARRLGLPVEGHVPASLTAAEVSAAGQKSIEHLTGMDEEKSDVVKAHALFAVFKKNGTWQCPTLIMRHNYASLDDVGLAADPRLKYVKPSWRKRWLRMTSESVNLPADEWRRRKETVRKEKELVGEMQKAGVHILAGTDDANPYSFPGFSLHDELAMLVEGGLTPSEALQAATLNPARFFGRLDALGTVEKGKLADLLLLDADPLEDIRNTKRISAVVSNGQLLDRKELDRMLAEVESAAQRK